MNVVLIVVNARRDSRVILTEAVVWTLMNAAYPMLAESMPFAVIHQELILVPALRVSRVMHLRNVQVCVYNHLIVIIMYATGLLMQPFP